ncbi:single-stranded DNA-binding protein [Vitreoscilla massiliensis]|uniref:Single-stranded DNA-binding protein n=1 Tax=Vitreoscilla massiliensis TaxID=1689272 RepID=A0ABY4E4S5_9NEIS|nr:single-stranded DNA-binding protein [Vitreoscilla massiliensis]UOO90304.1 single-stranded DNA-binding protein [Vitreoscilla massiliensis]
MSVNKVILVGRLGRDPEVRYLPNGEAVANFGVATSEQWKDRNGERQERTEWHNITMYRRLAEIAGQYLKKGSQVYIEGRIQSRKYTGKDGVERTAYEIIANEMKMIGGRDMGGSSSDFDGGDYAASSSASAAPVAAASSVPPAAPRREVNKPAPVVDDLDDDIPF